MDPETEESSHRWQTLRWWWATHAIGNGVGRIIFDVSIPYLLSGTDATSALSMGTMATLIGKLLSGPICGFLGTKRVGWMSLVALAAISLSVALVDDSVIVRAFLLAVAASRFVMCFTWPATNQMLRAWFPADEHGQAWGIMATSSRTGIVVTTLLLRAMYVNLSQRRHFAVAAVLMTMAAAVFALFFVESPEVEPAVKSDDTWEKSSKNAANGRTVNVVDDDGDIAALAHAAMANVDCNAVEMDEEIDSDNCGEDEPEVGVDDIVTIASMARTAMARSDASALEHDEEVDSDEAFGDDDEMEYNKHFPASPTTLRQRNTKEIPRKDDFPRCTPASLIGGHEQGRASDTTAALSENRGVLHQLFGEFQNPIVWCACVVQMTATPIAEFQSQVPIMLESDPYFTPSMVSGYTMVWHLGVLAGALLGGKLIDLDSSNMWWRLCVIGGPMVLAVALLHVMATEGTGAESRLFSGVNKVPAIFFLAALHSPAQYLVMGTTVSRHTHASTSATVASFIDMMGYIGSFLLLSLASAEDASAAAPTHGLSPGLLKNTQLFAAVCAVAVAAVYTLENRRSPPKEKTA